jgi:hypothetical protein
MRVLRKPPAPWLFSLLILPLGIVVVGFNFTAFPLLLAQAGVPVDRIASLSSIINLPGVIGFLFAPVVDIKFRRRTWLVLASLGTALSACLYFPLIGASHLVLMTAIILVGGLIAFLVSAACGGLIVKTLSESAQPHRSSTSPRMCPPRNARRLLAARFGQRPFLPVRGEAVCSIYARASGGTTQTTLAQVQGW